MDEVNTREEISPDESITENHVVLEMHEELKTLALNAVDAFLTK